MSQKFLEGERYRHENSIDTDIMVLGIHSETEDEIQLAVLFVLRTTGQEVAPDGIIIKRADYDKWTKVEQV